MMGYSVCLLMRYDMSLDIVFCSEQSAGSNLREFLFLFFQLIKLLLQFLHLVLLLIHVVEQREILVLVLHERSNLRREMGRGL